MAPIAARRDQQTRFSTIRVSRVFRPSYPAAFAPSCRQTAHGETADERKRHQILAVESL
jgi:hypothetical protein